MPAMHHQGTELSSTCPQWHRKAQVAEGCPVPCEGLSLVLKYSWFTDRIMSAVSLLLLRELPCSAAAGVCSALCPSCGEQMLSDENSQGVKPDSRKIQIVQKKKKIGLSLSLQINFQGTVHSCFLGLGSCFLSPFLGFFSGGIAASPLR